MEPIALLKDLIARPSVNPMGRTVSGPEFLEGRMSDYLVDFFARLGVPYQRIEVVPGRANVVARLDRPGSKTTVLFDAHQDTVPVDGMTIAPFEPRPARCPDLRPRLVRRQRRNGGNARGVCAAGPRAAAPGRKRGDVLHVRRGIDRAGRFRSGQTLERSGLQRIAAGNVRPDVAVVAEPTQLDVVVAHKGATRPGSSARAAEPATAPTQRKELTRFIAWRGCWSAWKNSLRELPSRVPPHPLCGPPTFSVGRIEGGISVNTVPDECTIEIDRRVIPGEEATVTPWPKWPIFSGSRLDFDVEMIPPWSPAP